MRWPRRGRARRAARMRRSRPGSGWRTARGSAWRPRRARPRPGPGGPARRARRSSSWLSSRAHADEVTGDERESADRSAHADLHVIAGRQRGDDGGPIEPNDDAAALAGDLGLGRNGVVEPERSQAHVARGGAGAERDLGLDRITLALAIERARREPEIGGHDRDVDRAIAAKLAARDAARDAKDVRADG